MPVVHPIAAPGRAVLASRYDTRHQANPPSGGRRAPAAGHDARADYPVPLLRPPGQRQRRLCLRTHRRVPRWPGDSHAAPATSAGHAHGRGTGRRKLGPHPPRPHPYSRGSLLAGQPGAGDTGPGLTGGSSHGGRPRALLLRSVLPCLLCLRDGAPARGRAADLPRTCGWQAGVGGAVDTGSLGHRRQRKGPAGGGLGSAGLSQRDRRS